MCAKAKSNHFGSRFEVLVFSTVLYAVDDPENIDSLATAIWMCTVTVTTVGYGRMLRTSQQFLNLRCTVLETHAKFPTCIELCAHTHSPYSLCVTAPFREQGDITPRSWPAKIVSGMLCFISVLFMAMPLSA